MTRYSEEVLLFRRQFVIGPRFVDAFPSWTRVAIRPGLAATVHPDLPVHQVAGDGAHVLLLGYALDPDRPAATDGDILNGLLPRAKDSSSFLRELSRLGGRFVVLVDTGTDTMITSDSLGFRQVFYVEDGASGEFWCASQPALLGELLPLAPDPEALGYLGACESREYWWPGRRTLYRGVFRLLPNHVLDLRTRLVRRYWPDSPSAPQTVADAVEGCVPRMQGLLTSARNRFPLAQTVTAGLDSRLSLAASRHIAKDVTYFSMAYWGRADDFADHAVPARLLAAHGLRHHLLRCSEGMEPDFERYYMHNVAAAHYVWGGIAQGLHEQHPQGSVLVRSNAAQMLKSRRQLPAPPAAEPMPAVIASLFELPPCRFVLESIGEWLAAATDLHGYDVLEIFYWENFLGSWQGSGQHEWDIVTETLDPLNCRTLLARLLSVPRPERVRPEFRLHRALIQRMWPEILEAPVNPHKAPHWSTAVRRVLTRGWSRQVSRAASQLRAVARHRPHAP